MAASVASALRWSCLALTLLISACGVPVAREVRYTGDVTPQRRCGSASQGTITVSEGKFAFTPSDGVILLRGDVGADGTAVAQFSTTGVDKKPYVMALTAKIDGEQVSGTYTTPRCTFNILLMRIHPSLL